MVYHTVLVVSVVNVYHMVLVVSVVNGVSHGVSC